MRGGFTAVVGILKGKEEGPTVAFRFDMDALPVKESAEEDHFPATEGFAMVQKGLLDDVDYLFCQHLGGDRPFGEIRGGSSGFLATTKLVAHFHGVSSHAGATPEKGRNALLGAATALLNIHAIPRFSTGTTRINVGILEGGTAANIIPSYAKMHIETRSVSEVVNNELEDRVRNIIAHSASMHELDHTIEVIGAALPITCDPKLITLVLEEAGVLGSEDASFMIRRVQERGGKGTYMNIGCEIPAPHHHPKFDIQEEILSISVQHLHRIAKRVLR